MLPIVQPSHSAHDIAAVSWCGSNAQQTTERKSPLKGLAAVQALTENNDKCVTTLHFSCTRVLLGCGQRGWESYAPPPNTVVILFKYGQCPGIVLCVVWTCHKSTWCAIALRWRTTIGTVDCRDAIGGCDCNRNRSTLWWRVLGNYWEELANITGVKWIWWENSILLSSVKVNCNLIWQQEFFTAPEQPGVLCNIISSEPPNHCYLWLHGA